MPAARHALLLAASIGMLAAPGDLRAQADPGGAAPDRFIEEADAGAEEADGGAGAEAAAAPVAVPEPAGADGGVAEEDAEASTGARPTEPGPTTPPAAAGPFLTPYSRQGRVKGGFRVFGAAVSGALIGNGAVLAVGTFGGLLLGGGAALFLWDAGVLGDALALVDTHPVTWTLMLTAGGVMSVGMAHRAGNSSLWKTPLAALIVAGVLATGGGIALAWLTLEPEGYAWEWPMLLSTVVVPLLGPPVLLTLTHWIFRKPQPYWDRHAPAARRRRLGYLPPLPFALRTADPRLRLVPAVSLGTLVF